MIILLVIIISVCAFGFFMLYRYNQVYKYRMKKLSLVFKLARHLRQTGNEWDFVLRTYDSVSYRTMLWQWWRPLNSFYKGTILSEEGECNDRP